jgi:transcriptional regulator with XRE-family HTH domain
MLDKPAKSVDRLISQNIRATRLNRGVSQTELAKRIGLTFQQVQKYESGVNGARGGRLVQIARALNIAVVAFFEGTEIGCLPIHSELPSLIVNHDAIRMLRAFSKLKQPSSQKALVTLAEELVGKQ